MKQLVRLIILYVGLFDSTTILHAQNYTQLQKLVAADRNAGNQFGSAVSISGNYAVVGAGNIAQAQIANPGNCAYVFQRKADGSWMQIQKLTPHDPETDDAFGFSVSISGDYIIVGAPRHDHIIGQFSDRQLPDAGAAYIFSRNTSGVWVEEKQLSVSATPVAGDMFGYSVSTDGTMFLIGAPGRDLVPQNPKKDCGEAFLFKKYQNEPSNFGPINGWGQYIDYLPQHPVEGQGFGISVSVDGRYAIVGSPNCSKDASGANDLPGAGAAYVFITTNTTSSGNLSQDPVSILVSPDRAQGDQFGQAVAVKGNQMIIGAPYEDEDAAGGNRVNAAGSAYIFQLADVNVWRFTVKLVALDRAVGDMFGGSVSIYNKYAIVGAMTEDENASGINSLSSAGSAYVFINDPKAYDASSSKIKVPIAARTADWFAYKQIKLVNSDRAAGDWFGYAVAVNDSCIMIGTPLQDKDTKGVVAADAGAVYMFRQTVCVATASSISPTACKSYISPSNRHTWTRSGIYKDTIANNSGCDSIITINLTIITKADTSVTIKGNTITANAKNADFMWIDCSTNGIMRVPTLRTFTPTVSGSYAVHVDQSGCIGVSSCYKIVIGSSDPTTNNNGNNKSNNGNNNNNNNSNNPPSSKLSKNASKQKAFLEVNKIVANDRTHNDAFGTSVSISGNYAVIGAPTDDDDEKGGSVLGAGSAYIFRLDDGGKWKQMQKISAFDRTPGAAFGCSVGISGNYLVVGANRDSRGVNGLYDSYLSGSAYVYQLVNGTWYFMQKIIANPTTRDGQNFFGTAVAIDGITIVVSAPDDEKDTTDSPESNISSSGSVFVYTLTSGGWIQTQKLVARDRVIGNWFGNSVAICGDNIIAGCWGNHYDANLSISSRMEFAGAAYIFERQGGRFVQTQKLVAEDRSPYDEFGFSVGISGDYAVVGARRVTLNKGDDGMDDYTGNAYIFKRNSSGVGWSQQMKINPDDRTKWDYLGTAVGISGDYLVASAWGQDTDSLGNYMADAGAIYVYYLDKSGNWVPSDKVSPFYKHQLGHFGVAAAISDCNIIGSSSTDQTDENDNNEISGTGAAYIFTAANCNNNGRCNDPSLPQNKIPIDRTNQQKNISNPIIKPPKADSVELESSSIDFPFYNTDSLDVIKKSLDNKPCTAMTIEEKKVYKECSKPEVFLIYKGRKIYIPTQDALYAMWYQWSDVNVVPDGALDKYPRYNIESASLTPSSLVFPANHISFSPIEHIELFSLNGISNTIPIYSQRNETQIGELRGWIINNACPSCGDGADCKVAFELDTDWADSVGIDLQKILRVGNVANGEPIPNSPQISARRMVSVPAIDAEVTSSGKLGILTDNQSIPSDWTYSGVTEGEDKTRCFTQKWSFDFSKELPFSKLTPGQYVRMKGSLVTDDPHDIFATFERDISRFFATPDKSPDAWGNEWRGSVADWEPGVSPQTSEHYARWTEIHPPDLIEALPDKPKEKTVYGVELCARAYIAPSILIPLPPANPCEEIGFDIYPQISKPSPNHELVYEELRGPECYFPLGEKINGSWITRYDDHIHVYAKVCGGGIGGSPGRFKAIYRVYWKEKPVNELTRFGRFVTTTGDTVVYSIEPNAIDVAAGVVDFNFSLERGNIGELKRMNLPDGSGSSWNLDIIGDIRSAKESLWAGQVNNGQSITFYKFPNMTQEVLKVPLGDLQIASGSKVTFSWLDKNKSNVTITAH